MRKILMSLMVLAVPAGAMADGFGFNSRRLEVRPVSDTTFEVIQGSKSSSQAFWCAAGFYVENALGRYQSRIYIAEGKGPSKTFSGRTAVTFSTEPVGDPVQRYTLTTRQVGASLTSGTARKLCVDSVDDFF